MSAVPFKNQADITDVAVSGETASVDFWYCRSEGAVRFLEIGLMDVRAADGIRVHYDFDRDGFVVCQPKPIIESIDKSGTINCGEEWVEVGFFASWKFDHWDGGCPPDDEIEAARLREDVKAKEMLE